MSSTCAKIGAGVVFDCDDPLVGGVEAETLVLFNWDDVDRVASTKNATNKQALETLILIGSPTPLGYVFEGINNSIRPNNENVRDGFFPFKNIHTIEFVIFDRSVAVKETVRDIQGGNFLAVYFRKGKTVEIMGFDRGLSANLTPYNEYEEDGAYTITIATNQDQGETEPFLPLTFIGVQTGSPLAFPTFEQLKTTILALT